MHPEFPSDLLHGVTALQIGLRHTFFGSFEMVTVIGKLFPNRRNLFPGKVRKIPVACLKVLDFFDKIIRAQVDLFLQFIPDTFSLFHSLVNER